MLNFQSFSPVLFLFGFSSLATGAPQFQNGPFLGGGQLQFQGGPLIGRGPAPLLTQG